MTNSTVMKSGAGFLYDEATGDIVGVKDSDGGEMFFVYGQVWDDLDSPIIIRTTGPAIPTLETVAGNLTAPQWAVNDVNMCEGQELPHCWKEGSEFVWHIHVLTNGVDSTARYLRFEIEWSYAMSHGVFSTPETITSADLAIPANTPDRTHIPFEIGRRTITNGVIATHMWPRLKRVASVGTAPSADPFCTMLQAHILCDTLGSRAITTKN